jgi:hypothetical protein
MLTGLHGTLGFLILVAGLLFALVGGITAWLGRGGDAWVVRLRLVLEGILVVQVLVGAVVFISGARPTEWLHFVYGVAILAVIPLATTFASEAPPRARSGVLAVAGVVILLLAWRLLSTG